MSQHSLNIANQAFAATRSDLNNALVALGTLQSGATAPATTFAHMLWADTTSNLLKKRNAANNGWLVVRTIDESFVLSRAANTILVGSDIGKTIVATAGFTQTFTAAATLGDGWCAGYNVQSGATIVFDPNGAENIDGAATKSVVGPSSGFIFCNGTAFYTIGFPVAAAAAVAPPVRQTVLSGPVDSNGLPNFGGSTGSGTVTIAGTIIATVANGFTVNGAVDRIGLKVNPSWAGLTTNGTMYLGVTVNSDGTLTEFSSTLQPVYQFGGTYSITNNQRTFNQQAWVMKVGNGASAVQSYDVFFGEVTVAGGVVTAITWYGLMGRYVAPWTATLPGLGTLTTFNHNLGINPDPDTVGLETECTTTDAGYAVGDRQTDSSFLMNGGAIGPVPKFATRLTCGFTTGNTTSMAIVNKASGAYVATTSASWKYRMVANRGF